MNMSFSLTTPQMYALEKTVTRRLGWMRLREGQIVTAVEKAQGLKRGEKVKVIHKIRVVSVSFEPLEDIKSRVDDCRKEGFPDLTPDEFIEMFCKANKCDPNIMVRRIEFSHILDNTPD